MRNGVLQLNPTSSSTSRTVVCLAGIVVSWIAVVVSLAVQGAFEVPPGDAPLPVLLAIMLPVAAFAGLMAFSPGSRRLALNLDPVLLTELQAWRIFGGLFLVVYSFDLLPGLFAWPAGVGDFLIGITAPFVAWRLSKQTGFLRSMRFRAFHYLGILDLVLAVATGVAARTQIPGLVDHVTTAPMSQLPLVLIPGIAVPMFVILHLLVLMQAGWSRR